MNISLSVPSKTFLVGEYLALKGGPSLIINTEPRFELKIKTEGEGRCQGIHPQSPAGLWLRQNNTAFQMVDIEFVDPHFGKGGLGASSAQFDLVYAWSQMSGLALGSNKTSVDPEELYKAYRRITWTEQGVAPSGADVVSQWKGQVSYFAASPFQLEALDWPFKEQDFILFRTGNKISTHEHLNQIDLKGTAELQDYVLTAYGALKKTRWADLCNSVNEYATALQRLGWVAQETQFKITQLLSDARIHAMKGCGAMGADVILILCDKMNTQSLCEDLLQKDIEPIATSKDLAKGFGAEMDFQVDLQPAEV